MKDKVTHRSKGVAFVLFLERDSAYQCIRALNAHRYSQKLFHKFPWRLSCQKHDLCFPSLNCLILGERKTEPKRFAIELSSRGTHIQHKPVHWQRVL